MDAARDHGIGVIATLGGNMILSSSEDQKRVVLKQHVERLKDHPALLGYEPPDEIAWADYSADRPGKNRESLLNGWLIVSSNYILTLLQEFEPVVKNGTTYGADMSVYDIYLSNAWSDYLVGDYGGSVDHIGN